MSTHDRHFYGNMYCGYSELPQQDFNEYPEYVFSMIKMSHYNILSRIMSWMQF